jgi:glycosyltransferase involved in cell wall biosynthesis
MTEDVLRVLMVNTYQTGGGAGRVGELLSAEVRRAGIRVEAFVAHNPTRDPALRPAGNWRERALVRFCSRIGMHDFGALSSLLWATREEFAAADLLHLHNLHGDYVSLLAAPLWGWLKPVVWTLHDAWALTGGCATPRGCERWRQSCGACPQLGRYPVGRIDRTSLLRRLKPKLLAAARPLIVTPSRWLAERVAAVREYSSLQIRVIPNPVDCDAFRPLADKAAARRGLGLDAARPTVVLAGQDWSDSFKGADHAVTALRIARRRSSNLQLLAIGGAARRLLAESGVGGVSLGCLEEREAVARALGCADVCLFPSLAENYPLTTLEALASGVPVVAYAVGGVPEQVRHGESGLLAPEGQALVLGEHLAQLLAAPARSQQLGAAGRAFALTCAAPRVTAQYQRVYCEAVAAWRRRHGRDPRFGIGRLSNLLARRLGWVGAQAPASRKQDAPTDAGDAELAA